MISGLSTTQEERDEFRMEVRRESAKSQVVTMPVHAVLCLLDDADIAQKLEVEGVQLLSESLQEWRAMCKTALERDMAEERAAAVEQSWRDGMETAAKIADELGDENIAGFIRNLRLALQSDDKTTGGE